MSGSGTAGQIALWTGASTLGVAQISQSGGNIGVGLLGLLDAIGPDTRPVVEVSHTQLESVEASAHWACLTNVTPNHLDQFSWDDYVDLKRRVFAYQRPDDVAVFNFDDPVSRDLAASFDEQAARDIDP